MNDGNAYNSYANPWPTNHPIPSNQANMKLARAYFVIQRYTQSFSPREALNKGTMFPELYRPWLPQGRKGI